jgi:hypothetical protein
LYSLRKAASLLKPHRPTAVNSARRWQRITLRPEWLVPAPQNRRPYASNLVCQVLHRNLDKDLETLFQHQTTVKKSEMSASNQRHRQQS